MSKVMGLSFIQPFTAFLNAYVYKPIKVNRTIHDSQHQIRTTNTDPDQTHTSQKIFLILLNEGAITYSIMQDIDTNNY